MMRSHFQPGALGMVMRRRFKKQKMGSNEKNWAYVA